MADDILMNHEQILELHDAVMSSQLVNSRPSLLAGIDAKFVARLPHAPIPGDQILLDLASMNEAGALADGSVPLTIWLKNAIALSSSRAESAVFKSVLLVRWPAHQRGSSPPRLHLSNEGAGGGSLHEKANAGRRDETPAREPGSGWAPLVSSAGELQARIDAQDASEADSDPNATSLWRVYLVWGAAPL